MNIKIAIQMDHIQTISIEKDSTFALGLEAQKRGYSLFHYTPDDLFMLGGKVFANIEELKLQETQGKHFSLGKKIRTDLNAMDIILLRQDPPFNMHYITTTYFLERLLPSTMVINNPEAVRNNPEKMVATLFSQLMPETLITNNEQEIFAFQKEFGDIILKPLYANAGEGVFLIKKSDPNFLSLLETFKKIFPEPFILQNYLHNVKKGDKRIILIDGKFAGAYNRIPAKDNIRSNIHVGGLAKKTTLTDRELEICETIGPYLSEKGLLLAGIDIIDGYLTEINVTSPTGISWIKHFENINIAEIFWNIVEQKIVSR